MPTKTIHELTPREREFFFRGLAEDPADEDSWRFEGYANLNGRFGLFGVINPRHPFNG